MVARLEEVALRGLLEDLGPIVEETWVRQVHGVKTYLAGRETVPMHTDHPEAHWVAWRCEAQDPTGGASVLTDGASLLAALGERAAHLEEVVLQVPKQLPRQVEVERPMLREGRLYYAPWYRVVRASPRGLEAAKALRAHLAMGRGRRRVRLEPGEVLVVDNGRWLHGRDALPEGSPRSLRRWWVA